MKRYFILLTALLLLAQIPIVQGDQEPSLIVTISEDSVNVKWEIKLLFEDLQSYELKVDEIRRAYENNYDRRLEALLEGFLTGEFSRHIDKTVQITDLEIDLQGSGSHWSEWMEVSTQFTVKGLENRDGDKLYVNLSWLTLKLSDRKVDFEDKDDPEIVYSFYPKYLLAVNWANCFNWDLTARTPEQNTDSLVLILPSRHEYKPFQEYSEVRVDPEKPMLKIRLMDSEGNFEAKRAVIPIPPKPLTFQEHTIKLLVDNWVTAVVSVVAVCGITLFGRYQVRRRAKLLVEKQREQQAIEQLKPLSNELRSEYGTRKVSLTPTKMRHSTKNVKVSRRMSERLFGKSDSEDWHSILGELKRSLAKICRRD